MKTLSMLVLLAGAALLSAGCGGTPVYTAQERYAQIDRNFGTDFDQIADDIDHILLLRPSGTLSPWNVFHRE
jgi:hypothetical protein